MRLLIERRQDEAKTMFGRHRGVDFTLWFRLELTPEEERLVQHYDLAEHVLIRRDSEDREPWVTVAQARAGFSHTLASIETVHRNEQVIRKNCQNFKVILEIAQSFG